MDAEVICIKTREKWTGRKTSKRPAHELTATGGIAAGSDFEPIGRVSSRIVRGLADR